MWRSLSAIVLVTRRVHKLELELRRLVATPALVPTGFLRYGFQAWAHVCYEDVYFLGAFF